MKKIVEKVMKRKLAMNYEKFFTQAHLIFPYLNDAFNINTGACDTGIGTILYRSVEIWNILAKKPNESQCKYSTTEKRDVFNFECNRNWKSWIGGGRIVVFTDSKNIMKHRGVLIKKPRGRKEYFVDLI